MYREAKDASERFADEEKCTVEWSRIWNIEPIAFHPALIELLRSKRFARSAGKSHRLPSGRLHDAAEVSRAGIPTVMMFVQSLRGISHNKIEDTQGRASRDVGAGAGSAGIEDRGMDTSELNWASVKYV